MSFVSIHWEVIVPHHAWLNHGGSENINQQVIANATRDVLKGIPLPLTTTSLVNISETKFMSPFFQKIFNKVAHQIGDEL